MKYTLMNNSMILWSLGYILYFDFKTFAPKCEVKIVVLIVLLINANFATYYFTYYNVSLVLIFAIIVFGSCEAICFYM